MLSVQSHFNTIDRIKELIANLRYLDSVEHGSQININCIDFATPLAITPLAANINRNELRYDYEGDAAQYLKIIRFPEGIDELSLLGLSKTTYIPIIHLRTKDLDRSTMSEMLSSLHTQFLRLLKMNVIADATFISLITNNTFGFVLGEMVDNIEEHSKAENVYLFAQYWPKTNSCELCILDDGEGLYGSLKNANRDVQDSMDALKKVLETGLSAKTEYGDIRRGTGIKNTRAAITNKEINGEFFVMSGNAGFLHSAQSGENLINFGTYSWKGTVIMLRINKPFAPFNLYNYVK